MVRDDDVDVMETEQRESFDAVGSGQHRVAGTFKDEFAQLQAGGFVVNEQDGQPGLNGAVHSAINARVATVKPSHRS